MLASNVRIIAPTKQEETKSYDVINKSEVKRVCAYCRVSTDSEEQINSYKSQVIYYEKFIKEHEGWIFAGIYADEGITGTSMRKRKRFREMIADALDGKIDMIICKSVPRFARCVVDILNIIEQLNQKGIPILFEMERLNSLDDKQATRTQILIHAANAEDYSQSLSESVKWGIRRQIERGNYPFSRCYGYNVEKKKVTINKEEAEVVKFIYKSFLAGDSYRQIARKLEERKILSPMGKEKWYACTVIDILANVRYKGDLHLQRTTTSDIKFRKQIKNETSNQYYITDHHEPIISKAEWNKVEKEREYRNNLRGFSETGKTTYSSKYPFSNRVYCLQCGSRFRRHGFRASSGKMIPTWVCINHKKSKANCSQKSILEERLEQAFVEALNEVIEKKEQIMQTLLNNVYQILKERKPEESVAGIDTEISKKQSDLMKLIQGIGTMDTFKESQAIMNEIEELKKHKDQVLKQSKQCDMNIYRIDELKEKLESIKVFDKFNGGVFRQVCEKVQIDGDKAIFVFNSILRIEKIVR